jgi:hypothetical protein
MSTLFDRDLLEDLRKAYAEHDQHLDKLAEDCDNELKIAVVRWAMKHIVEHAKEGGSYRTLIYDRLDFGPEAYGPLCSDGITISNEFSIASMKETKRIVAEHKYDALKETLRICDEPGCYDNVSVHWCGRMTCGSHYKKD